MPEASLPLLNVLLTPTFESNGGIYGLEVSVTFEADEIEGGTPVFDLPLKPKSLHVQREAEIWDVDGKAPCSGKPSGKGQTWISGRNLHGTVTFRYCILPSTSEDPKTGLELELHRDQTEGGLLGSGFTFIPIPVAATTTDRFYRITVQWNLDQAPKGTRAVWTFGEGPDPISKIGSIYLLSNSVYMIGPIQSNPPIPINNSISDYYGYYWFGSLPSNIEIIQKIHLDFLLKVANFFSDPPTAENPYRSFVRNIGHIGSFGGSFFNRSHIFDYDSRIAQAEDYDLMRRLSCEMSHIWLGPPATADEDQEIDWFYEGLKNCLSVYFPFRNGFRTGHYFQATISMLCTRYYTNPLIHIPHDEVVKLASAGDEYAKELLSSRAWAFAVGTDLRARRISYPEIKRPVEDLAIKPLAKDRASGKPHGVEQWLGYLKPLMGSEAHERYEEMLSGQTILLNPELFGAKTHYLKQVDQEVLDFGIDRRSFYDKLVKGLKKGSRAEEAGLKEGDIIVSHSYLWRCVDHFEEKMEIIVKRDGSDVKIVYWPRSYEMSKSWQMIKKEDEVEK